MFGTISDGKYKQIQENLQQMLKVTFERDIFKSTVVAVISRVNKHLLVLFRVDTGENKR